MRPLHGVSIVFAIALTAGLTGRAAGASWRPQLGFESGANLGRLDSESFLGDGGHWKWGGGVAAVSRWQIAPAWAIEFAPGWERQARRGTITFTTTGGGAPVESFGFDQTVRFDRIVLPVRAAFRPAAFGWSIEGGMGAAWTAHAAHEFEGGEMFVTQAPASVAAAPVRRASPDAQIFEQVGTLPREDWTDVLDRWDAVAMGGIGWDRPIGGPTLRVRARWQQGLVDLSKTDTPLRLSSASVALGVLW